MDDRDMSDDRPTEAAAVFAANLMAVSIFLVGAFVGVVLAVGVLLLAPGAQVWLLLSSGAVAVAAALLPRRTLPQVAPAVALPTSRTDPDV